MFLENRILKVLSIWKWCFFPPYNIDKITKSLWIWLCFLIKETRKEGHSFFPIRISLWNLELSQFDINCLSEWKLLVLLLYSLNLFGKARKLWGCTRTLFWNAQVNTVNKCTRYFPTVTGLFNFGLYLTCPIW